MLAEFLTIKFWIRMNDNVIVEFSDCKQECELSQLFNFTESTNIQLVLIMVKQMR